MTSRSTAPYSPTSNPAYILASTAGMQAAVTAVVSVTAVAAVTDVAVLLAALVVVVAMVIV